MVSPPSGGVETLGYEPLDYKALNQATIMPHRNPVT